MAAHCSTALPNYHIHGNQHYSSPSRPEFLVFYLFSYFGLNYNEIFQLTDGKGYLLPFENETRDQDYPPPLGTFQVHRLKWTNFPVEANGIYQCYDANNLNIPISNITVNVAGIIEFMRMSMSEFNQQSF
jgi:hypothetical protein